MEAVRVYTPGKEADALTGVALTVNDGEKYSSSRTLFIEKGEIDDMINASTYMVSQGPKVNTAVSPELKFTSKSDAVIGMYYSDYTKKLVGFAKASTETVYMELGSLEVFRQSLTDLKALLK